MAKQKSIFVCRNCGLGVTRWLDSWKHLASPNSRGCGKAPVLMRREAYEQGMSFIFIRGLPPKSS